MRRVNFRLPYSPISSWRAFTSSIPGCRCHCSIHCLSLPARFCRLYRQSPSQIGRQGTRLRREFSYRNLNLYNTVNLAYTFFVSQVNKMDGELRPTSHYLSSSWNVGHIFNVSAIHNNSVPTGRSAKWYLPAVPIPLTTNPFRRHTSAWDARHAPIPTIRATTA